MNEEGTENKKRRIKERDKQNIKQQKQKKTCKEYKDKHEQKAGENKDHAEKIIISMSSRPSQLRRISTGMRACEGREGAVAVDHLAFEWSPLP